eukprot:364335-Chlamydomonas_euryale.AAC.4
MSPPYTPHTPHPHMHPVQGATLIVSSGYKTRICEASPAAPAMASTAVRDKVINLQVTGQAPVRVCGGVDVSKPCRRARAGKAIKQPRNQTATPQHTRHGAHASRHTFRGARVAAHNKVPSPCKHACIPVYAAKQSQSHAICMTSMCAVCMWSSRAGCMRSMRAFRMPSMQFAGGPYAHFACRPCSLQAVHTSMRACLTESA